MHRFAPLVLLLVPSLSLCAEYTPANPVWNQPIEPFTIAGNLHYVGASGVSAYLITTPDGHILLDSGFRETVPQIEANVAKLGHRFLDIRLLLINHAHYDHIGGMAEIRARTGARLLAHPADGPLMRRGGAGDFAFGNNFLYPAVDIDVPLHDGQTVTLGGTTLTAHFTPGHTRGSTTWTLTVDDAGTPRRVVLVSSLSAPDYSLVNPPAYPGIVEDFTATFARLRRLPCDIVLASHGWEFDLHRKLAARHDNPATNPFVASHELVRLVDRAEANLRRQISEQEAKTPAAADPAK